MSAFIDHQNDIENSMELQKAAIAVQSDLFRRGQIDVNARKLLGEKGIQGTTLFTPGVADMGDSFVLAALIAIAEYQEFSEENDPYGEHDFGSVKVMGQKVFWKIDLYDTELTYQSDRPYSPHHTRRVLTIMLPSEY
ncbi:MAG: DUF3768 domain-containing protein [Halocynthiibacter sp.]